MKAKQHPKNIWERKALKLDPNARRCDHPDCDGWGDYRAPKGRNLSHIKDDKTWYWFCLPHVRQFNLQWNYYKDMTEEEVWQSLRQDKAWDRPSWPIGQWKTGQFYQHPTSDAQKTNSTSGFSRKQDPFGFFDEAYNSQFSQHDFGEHAHSSQAKWAQLSMQQREALEFFSLTPHYTMQELKGTYRTLVKKYHPDVNHKDSHNDEMIKKINFYFGVLKK